MKKSIGTIALVLGLLAMFVSQAQEMGNAGYDLKNRLKLKNLIERPFANIQRDDVLEVEVTALTNVKADAYLAIFNLVQVGETAAVADRIIQDRIDSFAMQIKKLGVKATDMKVDMISLVPVYEYEVEKKMFSKTYHEIPQGFELQQNLHVKFTDGNLMRSIMTIAATYEIYDLVKVEYFIENPQAIYTKMMDQSIAMLKTKLANYEKLGMKLDTSFRIVGEQKAVYYPFERYMNYQAFSASSLEAIKKRSGVTQVRKPTTVYYQPVSQREFDIVNNATLLEPVVQYAYNIKVKFLIDRYPPKPVVKVKREKEFLLLTKDGDLKTLKVGD